MNDDPVGILAQQMREMSKLWDHVSTLCIVTYTQRSMIQTKGHSARNSLVKTTQAIGPLATHRHGPVPFVFMWVQ